jgi:hypothetical protein
MASMVCAHLRLVGGLLQGGHERGVQRDGAGLEALTIQHLRDGRQHRRDLHARSTRCSVPG